MVNLLADRRDEAKSKHLALAFRLVLANPIRDINRAHLDMEYPNTITLEHQYDLEREVSKEELKKAVWDCGNDKSPGPDGFTFGFYRHFWPIIEKDVFEVVKCFFNCDEYFSNDVMSDGYKLKIANLVLQRKSRIGNRSLPGMFKGIKLNSSTTLSHMFYADDAMFVGQWCDDNINTLIHVLECFYRASGLRINMSKSKIMGGLGTKVGGSMARSHAWKEVINKVSSRLSKWKMNTLSIGGRLTLLKSVLGSIPIFHLSIFKAPLTILRKLESIRSHFFNGHELSSKKATWIKWTNVLAPKVKGGLGVSSLFALNRALMLKWVWRFHA
ncbi:hypothetical protein Tco_0588341 [Tanacetum coccineum]